MLTGIEIAGLVLGIFPVLVSALEHYRAGLEPLQSLVRYKKELKDLRACLSYHHAKFLNSLELLLERFIQPKDLGALLRDPLGRGWSDENLQTRLATKLGNFDSVFLDIVVDFRSALHELREKLDVDKDGKVDYDFQISACSEAYLQQPLWSDKDAFQRAFDRIRHSFLDREKLRRLQKRLKENNKRLQSLTNSSVALASWRENRTLHKEDVDKYREHVSCLNTALRDAHWGCGRSLPHLANLRVGEPARGEGNGRVRKHCHRNPVCCGFDFLFSFHTGVGGVGICSQWNWHETHFEPDAIVASQPVSSTSYISGVSVSTAGLAASSSTASPVPSPQPKVLKKRKKVHFPDGNVGGAVQTAAASTFAPEALQQIQGLCLKLKSVREGAPPLGFLQSNVALRLVVYPVRRHPRPINDSDDDLVSLEEILGQTASSRPVSNAVLVPGRVFLTRAKRFYLAYICSWVFLRLYGTPWLGSAWSLKDLRFLRQLDDTRNPVLHEPFVSKAFWPNPEHTVGSSASQSTSVLTPPCIESDASSSSSATSTSSTSTLNSMLSSVSSSSSTGRPIRVRNPGVFILGVSLIELYFNKRLSNMYISSDLDTEGKITDDTIHLALERLVEEVYDEAGNGYGSVVRRCIRCQFDQRYDDLDNADFRQAFYRLVVLPLKENWKDFSGGRAAA